MRPRGTRGAALTNLAGGSLVASGSALLVAAALDLTDGAEVAPAFAVVGAVGVLGGAVTARRVPLPERATAATTLLGAGVVVVAGIVLSAVAYAVSGALGVGDAVYESFAGYATTALSVLADPEAAPRGLLAQRALTQWMGGLAALVVIVGLLPSLGVGAPGTDTGDEDQESARLRSPRLRRQVQALTAVYGGLTVIGAVLYLVAGLGPFDAVTHAMTTISTGGFSTRTGGLGAYDSAAVEWVAVAGMALAGAAFALLWRGLRAIRDSALVSVELAVYAAILVGATAVVAVGTAEPGTAVVDTVRTAAFTVTSVVSTTGFAVADWTAWPGGLQVLLLALMGIGAMSGSAGAGFRIQRALAMVAYIRREVVRQLHPSSVVAVHVGPRHVPEALVARMVGYQVLFVTVTVAGALALTLTGLDLLTSASGAISAMATVGPALGDLGPGADPAVLDGPGRVVVAVLSLAGRLEVYPVALAVLVPVGAAARRVRHLVGSRR